MNFAEIEKWRTNPAGRATGYRLPAGLMRGGQPGSGNGKPAAQASSVSSRAVVTGEPAAPASSLPIKLCTIS